ncbi:MAG TPA: hypothetical protein VF681_09435 [Abditibacteriaceae bacterium]|jgi:hypothetical protein
MAQDEFIDLYAMLELETDADIATIRKRASEKYLEAQNNLDHRNAAKRLQYQQMYEVYLPQARHLLLDPARRAEYNRYLEAYRSGKPLAEVVTEPVAVVETGGMASTDDDMPEIVEPDVDPEVLAAQREQLWGQWKSSLNFSEDEEENSPAPAASAAPVAAPEDAPSAQAVAPQAAPKPGARGTAGEPRRSGIQTVALGETKVAPKAAPQRITPEDIEKRNREEWERKRQREREEIVSDAVAGVGLTGMFIGGGITFVVMLILLFVVDSVLNNARNYPLGMSRVTFALTGIALSVALAAVSAVVTAKKLREKKEAELKPLKLEELQRLYK